MAKPAKRSPERKLQVVLSVLCGEVSVAEAARRAGVAEQIAEAVRVNVPHRWRVSRRTERLAVAVVDVLVFDGDGNAAIRGRGHNTSNPAMPGSAGQTGRNTQDYSAPLQSQVEAMRNMVMVWSYLERVREETHGAVA